MLITSICLVISLAFLGAYALPRINLSVGGNVSYKPTGYTVAETINFGNDYDFYYSSYVMGVYGATNTAYDEYWQGNIGFDELFFSDSYMCGDVEILPGEENFENVINELYPSAVGIMDSIDYNSLYINSYNIPAGELPSSIPYSYMLRFEDSERKITTKIIELAQQIIDNNLFDNNPFLLLFCNQDESYASVALATTVLFFMGPENGDPVLSTVLNMSFMSGNDPYFPIATTGLLENLDCVEIYIDDSYCTDIYTPQLGSEIVLGGTINNDPILVWEYWDNIGFDPYQYLLELFFGG